MPRKKEQEFDDVKEDLKEVLNRSRSLIKRFDILGITDLIEERVRLPIVTIEKLSDCLVRLDKNLSDINKKLTNIEKSLKRIEDKLSKL